MKFIARSALLCHAILRVNQTVENLSKLLFDLCDRLCHSLSENSQQLVFFQLRCVT